MYPKEVVAVSKSAKREARVLVERGQYTRYTYYDEKGQLVKEGKESIFLKGPKGIEHFFIVPTARGFLLIKKKETQASIKKRKIWDPKKKKAVGLF